MSHSVIHALHFDIQRMKLKSFKRNNVHYPDINKQDQDIVKYINILYSLAMKDDRRVIIHFFIESNELSNKFHN